MTSSFPTELKVAALFSNTLLTSSFPTELKLAGASPVF